MSSELATFSELATAPELVHANQCQHISPRGYRCHILRVDTEASRKSIAESQARLRAGHSV